MKFSLKNPTAKLTHDDTSPECSDLANPHAVALDATEKSRGERSWPAIACGAGFFSDGYLNGVIGSVNNMLKQATIENHFPLGF